MDRFQKNTIKSFRNVKKDILGLKEQITKIILNQEEIMESLKRIDNLKTSNSKKRKR